MALVQHVLCHKKSKKEQTQALQGPQRIGAYPTGTTVGFTTKMVREIAPHWCKALAGRQERGIQH